MASWIFDNELSSENGFFPSWVVVPPASAGMHATSTTCCRGSDTVVVDHDQKSSLPYKGDLKVALSSQDREAAKLILEFNRQKRLGSSMDSSMMSEVCPGPQRTSEGKKKRIVIVMYELHEST